MTTEWTEGIDHDWQDAENFVREVKHSILSAEPQEEAPRRKPPCTIPTQFTRGAFA